MANCHWQLKVQQKQKTINEKIHVIFEDLKEDRKANE